MHDEMTADFADATAEENSAIASAESLVASKKKEIDALTKAIMSRPRVKGPEEMREGSPSVIWGSRDC